MLRFKMLWLSLLRLPWVRCQLSPEEISCYWFCASFESFFAFYTIPKICSNILSKIFCFPTRASLRRFWSCKRICCEGNLLNKIYKEHYCWFCCFWWPLLGCLLYFPAMLYGCLGRCIIPLPCSVFFLVSSMIEKCQQVCCGGRTTLFKIFYYPPMLLAASFYYLWNIFCCARSCFCLGRKPCGPDCQAIHKRVCLVCGQRHKYYRDDKKDGEVRYNLLRYGKEQDKVFHVSSYENHQCKDGRRGSFAWSMDIGDPMCQCWKLIACFQTGNRVNRHD